MTHKYAAFPDQDQTAYLSGLYPVYCYVGYSNAICGLFHLQTALRNLLCIFKCLKISLAFVRQLTLYQTTHLKLFQTERVCRRQFKLDKDDENSSNR